MPSKKIEDAVPELQKAWPNIVKMFETLQDGFSLILTCTHRLPEEQRELFKQGRTFGKDNKVIHIDSSKIVTNCDGFSVLSPHNYYPAKAIDVCVVSKTTGKVFWTPDLYFPLLKICEKLNLMSGGNWKSIKDWPHIEIHNYREHS